MEINPLKLVCACLGGGGGGGGSSKKNRDTHNPLALNVDQDFSSKVISAGIVLFFFQSVVKCLTGAMQLDLYSVNKHVKHGRCCASAVRVVTG